jgi:hypothetical protein
VKNLFFGEQIIRHARSLEGFFAQVT